MRAAEISHMCEKRMTVAEARGAIDTIKGHVDSVRALVLDLYRREGWAVLGYDSWRACVASEFGQHQATLYRQLQAAMIEEEVLQSEPTGQIPARQLRAIGEVPSGERKAVWDEAVAESSGRPTAKAVEAIVDRKLGREKPRPQTRTIEDRSPDFDEADFRQDDPDADEPGNVLADEDLEPARGSRPARAPESSLSPRETEPDEDLWLRSLPLTSRLRDKPLELFTKDARVFYRLRDALRVLKPEARKALAVGQKGTYAVRVKLLLGVDNPKYWTVCPATEEEGCGGTGINPFLVDKPAPCEKCHGCGYRLRFRRPK